ncbi:MAG: lipopolysaccharide heptosyltransferase II [Phycisphaerales bacterium]|nr:lipopolysaccharide heptosyltransferase II [Phycisphaerales bacterium]
MPAMSNTSAIDANTRSLCVLLPSWVGDTVMATGLLRACAIQHPQTKIQVVVRPGLGSLLEGLPYISAIFEARMKGSVGPLRCARKIKESKSDAVLVLPNSFRSALIARLSGIRKRIGYARDRRGFLLTDAMTVPEHKGPISLLDYYQHLATFAFGKRPDDMTPGLTVTAEQLQDSKALLCESDRPLIILNPGGNRMAKRWPAEKFIELALLLKSEHGVEFAITGSPAEAELVSQIAQAIPDSTDLTAKGLSLATLKGVISRASLMITNDTGPRHIAAALGTPVVTLFGPTDHRWTTLPGVKERLLIAEPFLPEELVADHHADLCHVDRITTHDVFVNAQALLCETQATRS